MNTRAFLEALWPSSGIYCLATPFTPPGATRSTYSHRTYTSIADCVTAIERSNKTNIFFTVHTLKEHQVWNPRKVDWKTGKFGANETRTQANAHEARCFFFDLDVGDGADKYATQQEAMNGLEAFLYRTRLPSPLITTSGHGLHVYWRLDASIPSEVWRHDAARLFHLARRHSLLVDPSRTTDQASVLRVVGTLNQKAGRPALPCVAIQEGVETPTSEFLKQIAELVGSDVVRDAAPKPRIPRAGAGGNLDAPWDGPVRTLAEVSEVCEHVRNYCETGYTEGGYVEFYHLGCGIIPYVENGEVLAHDLAMRHPRCTDDYADTARETYRSATDDMPSSCATLDAKCGGDACARCPHAKLGKNPLLIATAVLKSKAAPPPTITAPDTPQPEMALIEPPYPYKRTTAGIQQTVTKTVKEMEIEENVLICPYDMFPFDMCERTELENAFSQWIVTIPNKGQIRIKVVSATLQDTRELHKFLLDHGMFITSKQATAVQMYMQHFMRSLQETTKANRQFDHLGWVDKSTTEFIMPTTVLHTNGDVKPCTLSALAKNTLSFVHTHGTLEGSIAAMEFYNKPEYMKHQFMVMLALAAPAFHATGHAGVVVNASGESGGSKSTALYAGASLWGYPDAYVINGTNVGSTLLARLEMIFTLSNLPVCIDEITRMDPADAKDFVFNATQRSPRGRLMQTGAMRPVRIQYKSTPLICSSNSSLHNLLGIDNLAGVAGNMRVFEMFFPKLGKENKPAADQFLYEIQKKHYGHIGPEFLKLYMPQRETIDEAIRTTMAAIDRKFGMTAPERYWSAVIAAVLVVGQIARQAGLLPFEVAPVRDWVLGEHLAEMRRHISSEEVAHSPAALIASFLNDKQGQTITVYPPTHAGGQTFADRDPHGAIVAHYDTAKNIMYVRKDAFRHWCDERKKNALRVMGDLQRSGVIVDMDKKATLGLGTRFASGRSICFVVDMAHPEIAATGTSSKVVALRQPQLAGAAQ